MKERREKECRKMILIIESLGFAYQYDDLLALYKSDRSKFLEIRDICDEFKATLKPTTPMANIFLRHEDHVVGFKSHPGVSRIDETDQLSSYRFDDLKPVILRYEQEEEEEEELTEEDKIEFITELMVDLEEILMEPRKKSKKRKASSSSSSSSSFDASFDCADVETDSVSDTSVDTESSSSSESS